MWTWIFLSALALANPEKRAEGGRPEPAKQDDYSATTSANARPYVFGWMDYAEPSVKLRGGTTKGIPVTLATEPSEAWVALQADGLDPREQDRLAILAMVGDYRISFDFLEVETYGAMEAPAAPYRAWATERVTVLESSDDTISLQHTIVMFVEAEEGAPSGPMLVKHWRQDWDYEPETSLEFVGDSHWSTRQLSPEERKGRWQQTVYQVDDSPRYSMRGTWSHSAAYSAWSGESAWRPLPRREYSARSDYQTLVGTNRLTIVPQGWVHSQDNVKTVLSSPRTIDVDNPALAREFGINRYERITGFDFSSAEAYWDKTGPFWERVRSAWSVHLSSAPTVRVAGKCGDERVYKQLFGLAGKIAEGKNIPEKKQHKQIEKILSCAVSKAN